MIMCLCQGRIFYQNITDAKPNYDFQIEEYFRYKNFIIEIINQRRTKVLDRILSRIIKAFQINQKLHSTQFKQTLIWILQTQLFKKSEKS
ncbi:hypothetical protein FGO68_gene16155 [Halteria grandinella]|uniref:Uncharacterized protein n=1 Tax=Halteria grandinella TaxID=5974 RepID=A0A8J8NC02_HALGN|nr:hypothetical protein FGO68_gene16155 [Halteria grandinella]